MSSRHQRDAVGRQGRGPRPGHHPGAAFGLPGRAGRQDGEQNGEGGAAGVAADGAALGPTRRAGSRGAPEGGEGPGGVRGAGETGGVDPELLPYLEAADAPDPEDPAGAAGLAETVDGAGPGGGSADGWSLADAAEAQDTSWQRQAQAEEEDLAALRELVAASMLPGGDLERLDELLAEVDAEDADDPDGWGSWEPQPDEDPSDTSGMQDPAADPAADLAEEETRRRDLEAAARQVEVSARMRQVETEILSRAPEHQVQPSLERVEAVLDILGHPERSYRTVHVAGTNGKTSTARITERLLAATGMRTGRFTSPHLATIRERITLDGEPISEEGFIAAWEDVAPYIQMVDERSQVQGGPRLSFFEVLTVMALAAFADAPVDVAVIEVGLGGRWDATNVIGPDVAVITPVARDHERWLGSDLADIAREKAGIIKDGAVVVTAHQLPEVRAQVEEAVAAHRAVERREHDTLEDPEEPGAGVLEVSGRQVAVGGQLVTLRTAAAVYEDVFVPLHGRYQAHNALLALAATEAVMGGRALPPRVVEEGLASVTSPGRLEVLRSSPTVLVDAAHNPHGVEALVEAVEEVFGFRHLVAVVGVMADKDVEGILGGLEPATDAVVCVPIASERAMDVEDLAEVAREVYGQDRVSLAHDLAEGVDLAATLAEGTDAPATSSGVVIVGSVLLAAQARALFGAR
ncbi:bifunctional folylpolyglutamate synthase/dihydrofolate synthase [Actinomyces lilanjuaniae]|uniref:tetrahydrofolate synthase n=1 Tax=Actinomyces lilanjuaniae TaxID=2321394 RepID=A0ABN5PRN3_9ACTO|nr:folylpolyglutamate synthase/dihydrofolate synthase family protein [Actinomyces lilanjuaniae]AYD89527.1 bifunctional folylpolyglutamate synthase/dihydrofolate synthase [Actinomyces lilanjuaniae]